MITVDAVLDEARRLLRPAQDCAAVPASADDYANRPVLDLDKRSFQISEFAPFHDAELVRVAYLALLRREPDASGIESTLAELRTGNSNFADVVLQLRQSAEGRAKGVVVHGLRRAIVIRKLCGLPVVGLLLRRFRTAALFPGLARNQVDTMRTVERQAAEIRALRESVAGQDLRMRRIAAAMGYQCSRSDDRE